MTTHLILPDTQVKPGVPTNHLLAAGNYAAAKKPDVIVHLGDHYDLPSLSSYEKQGSKYFHGKSYRDDVDAGNDAMELFLTPIREERARLSRNKKAQWNPRLIYLIGNHSERINRAINENPILEGTISMDDLALDDWEVHPYQVPVIVDGIAYAHNFVNPDSLTKNIISGTIENKLSKIKHSFTMGHQQRRQFGTSYNALGQELMGLVVGRFYQHDEAYMGAQGQSDWAGIVMKYEVSGGRYDPAFVSLDWLVENYG